MLLSAKQWVSCRIELLKFRLDGCVVTKLTAPFILFHWWYVDIFVYFSHNFITIPPVGWINQAHKHGVPILGKQIYHCAPR